MNIRIKYEKRDEMKYVSHLETIKIFDRAIRRSNINITFSKGFNPRPNISFALPTSVGTTSIAEYAEIEAEDLNEILSLNDVLPKGIYIIDAWESNDRRSLMASVEKARYEIKFQPAEYVPVINDLLKSQSIPVEKIGKKGKSQVDLKPLILDITVTPGKIDVLCLAGSKANLKPELLLKAIEAYAHIEFYDYSIEKKEIFFCA